MERRGLMARLTGANPSRKIPGAESVTAHLQDLLNTSLGSCSASKDIGLVPIIDLIHDFPLATENLEKHIRVTINSQEPRIENLRVVVTQDKESMSIQIEIYGRLRTQSDQTLQLSSTLDHRGRLHLR